MGPARKLGDTCRVKKTCESLRNSQSCAAQIGHRRNALLAACGCARCLGAWIKALDVVRLARAVALNGGALLLAFGWLIGEGDFRSTGRGNAQAFHIPMSRQVPQTPEQGP
jgi:hypothetical protein